MNVGKLVVGSRRMGAVMPYLSTIGQVSIGRSSDSGLVLEWWARPPAVGSCLGANKSLWAGGRWAVQHWAGAMSYLSTGSECGFVVVGGRRRGGGCALFIQHRQGRVRRTDRLAASKSEPGAGGEAQNRARSWSAGAGRLDGMGGKASSKAKS